MFQRSGCALWVVIIPTTRAGTIADASVNKSNSLHGLHGLHGGCLHCFLLLHDFHGRWSCCLLHGLLFLHDLHGGCLHCFLLLHDLHGRCLHSFLLLHDLHGCCLHGFLLLHDLHGRWSSCLLQQL